MSDEFPKLEFRRASAADQSQLVELRIQQLIDEGYPEERDIRDSLSTYFAAALEDGTLVCWIGEADGRIRATGGICFYQLPPSFSNPTGEVAYITNMYTHPHYRRRGIAAHLLDRLIEEAKAKQHASIRLHASDSGRSVYANAGFVDTGGYMALKL